MVAKLVIVHGVQTGSNEDAVKGPKQMARALEHYAGDRLQFEAAFPAYENLNDEALDSIRTIGKLIIRALKSTRPSVLDTLVDLVGDVFIYRNGVAGEAIRSQVRQTIQANPGCVLVEPGVDGNPRACALAKPEFYLEDKAEIIAVNLGPGFDLIELTPDGNELTDKPVIWSLASEDGQTLYARLTKPARLRVGGIKRYLNDKVCISFKPSLFDGSAFELSQYQNLANMQCCGVLTRNKLAQ